MRIAFVLLVLTLFPSMLFGHGIDGHPFLAGITHPIFGLDHLMSILAISVIGHHLMQEKPWLPSILFIVMMVFGGVLGAQGDAISFTELVIQLSVIICGIIIWGKLELTLVGYALFAIIFGFFHGHAHGIEMPTDANLYVYISGYVIGALIISAIGFLVAKLFTGSLGIRTVGAFIAGMGVAMCLA